MRDAAEWRSIVWQCRAFSHKSDLRDRNNVGAETACTVGEDQEVFLHDEIARDEAVADGAKPVDFARPLWLVKPRDDGRQRFAKVCEEPSMFARLCAVAAVLQPRQNIVFMVQDAEAIDLVRRPITFKVCRGGRGRGGGGGRCIQS